MRQDIITIALKLLWVIGLLALILVASHYQQVIKQDFEATYNPLNTYWFHSIVPFLFGLYSSLLFIKFWSLKIDIPLFLCVTIPLLILSFYIPVTYTIFSNIAPNPSSFSVPIPFWLFKINSFELVPIVAGLTFIVSLFGLNRQQSRH
ncbi:hypothetical protein [Lysinibacillus agricola]|uniref:hypothetical protein n=1 Tax=Lysinibacillus agricola TaxID=2590012 RepID=UPI003C1843DF